MVNRLLQEREARLAARGPGVAERSIPGNGGVAEGSGNGAITHPETAVLSSSRGILGGNGHSSARVEEGRGGDDGDGSPSTIRGNIFFASDLVYPDDASQGGGPNVHATTDGARAAAGEEPVETLLRRLHHDESHADTDIEDNELSCIDVANAARRWEKEDAAMTLSPPPPAPPLEPNDRHSPVHPDESQVADRRVREGGTDSSSRGHSPEGLVAAARRGCENLQCGARMLFDDRLHHSCFLVSWRAERVDQSYFSTIAHNGVCVHAQLSLNYYLASGLCACCFSFFREYFSTAVVAGVLFAVVVILLWSVAALPLSYLPSFVQDAAE